MHFDTILKTLFQSSRLRLLESLTEAPVREWINVEMPNTRMNKLDLVAWLTDGRLYHLELQSGNDKEMAQRMLERLVFSFENATAFHSVQHLFYVGSRQLTVNARQSDVPLPDYRHERSGVGSLSAKPGD